VYQRVSHRKPGGQLAAWVGMATAKKLTIRISVSSSSIPLFFIPHASLTTWLVIHKLEMDNRSKTVPGSILLDLPYDTDFSTYHKDQLDTETAWKIGSIGSPFGEQNA
jgi:hypothetical protein